MKRVIASLVALSVVTAPAIAATTPAAPAKATRQVKKGKVATLKDSKASKTRSAKTTG